MKNTINPIRPGAVHPEFFPAAILFLAVLWLFPFSCFAKTTTVEAEGVGFVVGGNIAAARDMAINDARLRAIEQGVGVAVNSRTVIIKCLLVEDTLVNISHGMVKNYTIISEGQDDKGVYRIKIRASVDEEELAETLQRAAGKRRILLVSPAEENTADNTGLEQAIHAFVEAGFTLTPLKLKAEKFDLLDKKKVTRLAQKNKTDLVLGVSIRADEAQCPVDNYCVAPTRGRMALWSGKSGAELARAVTDSRRGFGNTPDLARRDGIRRTGKQLGISLIEQLFHPPVINLKLAVRHLPDQKSYRQLLARVAAMRWVREVKPDFVGFHTGKSVFLLRFAGRPDLLGSMLTTMPDYTYEGRTNNTLMLDYRN